MSKDISKIRELVGEITGEELRYVDSFIGNDIGLFMPVAGACFYALTPLHTHPSYMFVLPFNDRTAVKVGGRVIKGRPGKMLALSPSIPHHELPSDSSPRYIAVFISKAFFENQLSLYPVKEGFHFNGELYDQSPNLISLLKRFMIEADNRLPGSETILHGISIEVCHSIIRSIFEFGEPADRITLRIEIDRAIEFMHTRLGEKLTVEEVAKAAHMSATHFSRVFKKEIGKTPMDYLTDIRLERVKKLLVAGDHSITGIALECGFNSPAYLSASFRKAYKMSPSDYRRSLKDGFISKKNSRITKDKKSKPVL